MPSAAVLIGPATLALVLLTGFAANVLQWVEDLAYRWETRPAFGAPRLSGTVRTCASSWRTSDEEVLRPWASARTYTQLAYLALAFPLGLAYFVFLVTGISVGVALVAAWVGVPILLGLLLSWRALGRFERFLHRQLLGVEIDEPFTSIRGEGSLWQRTKSLLTDAVTWRTAALAVRSLPCGDLRLRSHGHVVGKQVWKSHRVRGGRRVGLDFAEWGKLFDGEVFFDGIDERFALPVGLLLLSVQPHVVRALAWFHAVAGTALLGPSVRERERVLQARTTVLEERTKLAHELHDAVGHTVTLMTVQAGAGRKVFDTDPGFARSSLETIEESGRGARGLDHILGLLREDEGGGSAPAAGLDRLPDLVREVGDAGLVATLEVTGEPRPLPQGLDSSAYRIVQEALTNVLKHAGAAPATIRVDHQPGALVIEVIDDGPPAGPAVTRSRRARARRNPRAGRGVRCRRRLSGPAPTRVIASGYDSR